jgi:hypothetical protein
MKTISWLLSTLASFFLFVATSMCQTAVTPESPEHHFARLKYEEAVQQYGDIEQQMEPLKAKSAAFAKVLDEAQCVNPHAERTLDKKALDVYLKCLAARKQVAEMGEAVSKELLRLDKEQKKWDPPGLKVRMDHADDCLAVYNTTIDKKTGDLTTREADQITACKLADLYPPHKS